MSFLVTLSSLKPSHRFKQLKHTRSIEKTLDRQMGSACTYRYITGKKAQREVSRCARAAARVRLQAGSWRWQLSGTKLPPAGRVSSHGRETLLRVWG